jgi:hypothetical protein
METIVYIKKLRKKIVSEIKKTNTSIFMLIDNLEDVLIMGAILEIVPKLEFSYFYINQKIFSNNKNFTQKLKKHSTGVFPIPDSNSTGNKRSFICIIDNRKLLTGSYMLSGKNKRKTSLKLNSKSEKISFFVDRLIQINHHLIDNTSDPYKDMVLRINLLKNALDSNHKTLIKIMQNELEQFSLKNGFVNLTNNILDDLKNGENEKALSKTLLFLRSGSTPILSKDNELLLLELESESLDLQILALEEKQTKLERRLAIYEAGYNTILGTNIIRLLKSRIERLRKSSANSKELLQAEKDLREFYRVIKSSKTVFILDKEEKKQLKKIFREASKICHPDMVHQSQQKEAHKIFQELKDAYKHNDMEELNKIHKKLKMGIFKVKTEPVARKDVLKSNIMLLKRTRDKLEQQIFEIATSATYKKIKKIKDVQSYFQDYAKEINREIDNNNNMILNFNLN